MGTVAIKTIRPEYLAKKSKERLADRQTDKEQNSNQCLKCITNGIYKCHYRFVLPFSYNLGYAKYLLIGNLILFLRSFVRSSVRYFQPELLMLYKYALCMFQSSGCRVCLWVDIFQWTYFFLLNSITQVLVDIMEVFIMQVLSFAIMEDDKNMFDIFFMYAFFLA